MMKTTTLIATFVTFALTSCLLPYSVYASESGTQKQIDELLKLVKAQARRIDELESLLDIDSIKRRRRALGLLDCAWKSGPGRCGNGKWYRDANGLNVDQCKNECVKDGSKCFAIDFGNGYCNLFTKDQCSKYNTDKKYTHYMKPSSCDKPCKSNTPFQARLAIICASMIIYILFETWRYIAVNVCYTSTPICFHANWHVCVLVECLIIACGGSAKKMQQRQVVC